MLHKIKTNQPFYEFVGGGAGVGKSRLISAMYQTLNHRLNSVPGSNPSSLKVLLSAPTGKAAFGIGGLTLHSIFSLPVNQSNRDLRPLSNDLVNSIYSKLIDLKLIIIDEISMVGARMFSSIDARLKQIFKTNSPFGGISVILFGDLRQLSPVGDRWIFSPNPSDNYSVLVGSLLWELFKYFELTEVMRQRGDQPFAIALNNMASGIMTSADISLINSRIVSLNQVPNEAIHLFWSNEESNNFNALKLSQISTSAILSTAKDVVKGIAIGGQTSNILDRVKLFKNSETQGLSYNLTLKTTAKYMITVNINTGDGLVNGATGQLMHIDFESSMPSTLWLKFLEPSVGLLARSRKSHPSDASWTPIEKTVRTFQYKRNEQITVERNQFPVVPAEGITIHKSQGATYSKVVVHTRARMPRAALYVACSRATSADGLFILGNFVPPCPFTESDPVFKELVDLKTSKSLTSTFSFMLSRTSKLQIIYHNAQSLHAHIDDVRSDYLMMTSDILCFVETWSYPSENFEIPGLCQLNDLRIDSTTTRNRNKRGILVYAKTEMASSIQLCRTIQKYSLRKT
ncbi:PREDICTED: ATP-dependent DNA helicase pfh1-like [Rhagoletis zephyria]|uniref:ATP-dependent DNA helicase pfh1-like n=1 Tax=Rhagoletis zephyria TaxID=28612 RepID=UPI0008114B14|nr:PREDICTED: ATP-dependent DNA helicase pfh1-like [Rhagoletis zephyria]